MDMDIGQNEHLNENSIDISQNNCQQSEFLH